MNATALCKAAGKRLDRYWENQTTEEFIAELSRSPEFRGAEPVQAIVGGPPKLQGTWVHPQVAIHLAQWLSAEFAVKVSRWVFEWMSGQQPRGRPQPSLPGFIRRYLLNRDRVPDGHFSALEETMLNFVAPLEELGITIPDHLLPDGSQGRGFCAYLRHIHGIDTTLLPT